MNQPEHPALKDDDARGRHLSNLARAGALATFGLAVFAFVALQIATDERDGAEPLPLAVAMPVDFVSTVPQAAEVLPPTHAEYDAQQNDLQPHGG